MRRGNHDPDQVVLVDHRNRQTGIGGKFAVHRRGKLHRAFSVFVFNAGSQLLLQKRAVNKYHSPGLWSNTCCSHPMPGESLITGAHRRLGQEMGIDCPLSPALRVVYRTRFPNRLVEHELDLVLVGQYEGTPVPDPAEVAEWRWAEPTALREETAGHPEMFTRWFLLLLPRTLEFTGRAGLPGPAPRSSPRMVRGSP